MHSQVLVVLCMCSLFAQSDSRRTGLEYKEVSLGNSTVLIPLFWDKHHADVMLDVSLKFLSIKSARKVLTIDSTLSEEERDVMVRLRRQRVLDQIMLETVSRPDIHAKGELRELMSRHKRSAPPLDTVQDQLCAPIANAVPATSDTLSCDMQVDKLLNAKTMKIMRLNQDQILQEIDVCYCSAREVERCCGYYFWGTKRTWENQLPTNADLDICVQACKNVSSELTGIYLYKTGDTSYSCYWTKDYCNKGVIYSATRTRGNLHVPSSTLLGSNLKEGYCDLRASSQCDGHGGAKLIPLSEWRRQLTPPQFLEHDVDAVQDSEKGLILIYEPTWGGNVINITCHHSFLGQERIYSGLNGEFFLIPPREINRDNPSCAKIAPQLNNPALKFGKTIETRSELVSQYRYCILTKLAVESAVKVGTPIHNELLKGLTVRGNRNLAFFTLSTQLMALDCQPVEYDKIEEVSQNCYRCSYNGITVGYLDAPLGLMFRGRCISNDTQLVPHIGANWVLTIDSGIKRIVRSTTPLSKYIQAMETMSNSSTQLLRRLYGDPYAGVTEEANFVFDRRMSSDRSMVLSTGTLNSEWWSNLSVLTKIGSLSGGTGLIVCIIIIIIVCCRR